MSKIADRLEEIKGQLHSELQSRAVDRELTQLDTNNFVIEKLAVLIMMSSGLSTAMTQVLTAMGGLDDDGDEQEDDTTTQEGSAFAPSDSL